MSFENYVSALYEFMNRQGPESKIKVSVIATWLFIYENWYLNNQYSFTLNEYLEAMSPRFKEISVGNNMKKPIKELIRGTIGELYAMGLLEIKLNLLDAWQFSAAMIQHAKIFPPKK